VAGFENLVYNDASTCKSNNEVKIISTNALPYLIAYPNPANGFFNVAYNLSQYKTASLNLFDIAGRLVSNKTLYTAQNFQSIDIENLEPGVYAYIAFADGQKVSQGKVCVIRK
jgi:hypothetical protein